MNPRKTQAISAEWIARMEEAQRLTHVLIGDRTYARLRYGPDSPGLDVKPECRGCYVPIGLLHVISCMSEVCPVCGGQAFGCPCLSEAEAVALQ